MSVLFFQQWQSMYRTHACRRQSSEPRARENVLFESDTRYRLDDTAVNCTCGILIHPTRFTKLLERFCGNDPLFGYVRRDAHRLLSSHVRCTSRFEQVAPWNTTKSFTQTKYVMRDTRYVKVKEIDSRRPETKIHRRGIDLDLQSVMGSSRRYLRVFT